MPVQLRPYQDDAVGGVRDAFGEGLRSVLLQIPTGGGKTITAGFMLGTAASRGFVGFFICNRIELVEQTAAAFDKLGIAYGIIAAGFTPNPRAMVQICSIDTLKGRLAKILRPPNLVVWDECRGLGAAGWERVFNHWPKAKHLGLDATPIRLDGKGLDKYFERLVAGPTYSELVNYDPQMLVPFDVYAPSVPDLGGVKTVGGDYDQAATALIMDKPQVVGDIIAHYRKLALGKSGITFCVSRENSQHMASEYRRAGVNAVHLDGDSDKGERKRVVAAFRRREVQVICNVDLFSAGFDVPGVEVITMGSPTKSLAKYLQQAGRGSRPEPSIGKDRCILLDHAGNWLVHGMPDADRTWSLAGREKRAKKKDDDDTLGARQCASCFFVMSPPRRVCPSCGAEQEIQSREVERVDGVLERITPEMAAAAKAKADAEKAMLAKAQRQEVGRASSLEELRRIARERGYNARWADHVWATKSKRDRDQLEAYAHHLRR
jgi:superfamily II DNA or RNA helicase